MAPRLLSRNEAAAYCGLAANSFSAYIEPHVAALKIGNRCLYDVRAIDAWIDNMTGVRQSAASPDEWLNRG